MRLQLVAYQTNVSPYKIRCSVPKKRQYKLCMQRFNKALQTLKEDEKQHMLRNIRYAKSLFVHTKLFSCGRRYLMVGHTTLSHP